MIKGRYGYNQQRDDGSVWYQIFLSETLLSADEIVQRLSDAEMTIEELQFAYDECSNNKLFSRRKLETENKKLKDENQSLKKKIGIMADAFAQSNDLIEVEQVFYTKVYEPSEYYDEELLSEISNALFRGIKKNE